MSINTLLSNPIILDELITVIENYLPPSQQGITSLINDDGNVVDGVVGSVGNIDLNDNISVTTFTANELITPNIKSFSNDDITLSQNDSLNLSSVNLNDEHVRFFLNNSSLTLDNTNNLILENLTVNTGSMQNIFLLDGSDNQVLQTDGSGNLQWVDNTISNLTGYQKYIGYSNYQQTPQSGAQIEVFRDTFSGFTVGKTSIIEFNFTFSLDVLLATPFLISITINGDLLPQLAATINGATVHTFRGFTVNYVNTNDSQEIVLDIQNPSASFRVDANDYMNVTILERQ